jgi:preprotein translocase SecE subunit
MVTTNTTEPIHKRMIRFLRETWLELRRTAWPTKEELQKNTLLVLTAVVIVAAYMGTLDFLGSQLTNVVFGY